MPTTPATAPVSKPARWTGRVLSGLVIVFLLFDGAVKLVPWPVVTETMDKMGYSASESFARTLGIITIACTVLYAIPPTSILGAILMPAAYLVGIRHGATGLAAAWLIAYPLLTACSAAWTLPVIGVRWRELAEAVWPPVLTRRSSAPSLRQSLASCRKASASQ